MLKEQVTNPEPTTARKVPQAEREARLVNLRNRLNGVLIEGHAEPSHCLLDLATQLYDECFAVHPFGEVLQQTH